MTKNQRVLSGPAPSVMITEMQSHKRTIDEALEVHAKSLELQTAEQFGEYPRAVVAAFNDLLLRGGKRIRGTLAIVAYEMFGGKDAELILQAACALEILNTYILVADDIQDRSPMRRGGPTVHEQLRQYHEAHHLEGKSGHFGVSLAIDSFLIAQHYAMNIIATLSIDPEIRLRAMTNINKCFIVTAHGQTLDIVNESVGAVDDKAVNNVLEWKTAYYTFINPLQLGAILAGAPDAALDILAEYGLHAGRVFQLSDDILGIFSEATESGKSPLDDVKEGKHTALMAYALKNAPKPDTYFLSQSLGNQRLTAAEFEQCRRILIDCGALDYAKELASDSAATARQVIVKNTNWPKKSKQFLIELVQYLVDRKS